MVALACAGLSFTANNLRSKAVGWESVGRLLKTRPSARFPCLRDGVRGADSSTSMICFLVGGWPYGISPVTTLCALGRFDAAPTAVRKGELRTLGTSAKGTLRFDMIPSVCGEGGIDTAAMRNNTGRSQDPDWRGTCRSPPRDVLKRAAQDNKCRIKIP